MFELRRVFTLILLISFLYFFPFINSRPGDKRTSSLGDTTDDDLDEEEFQTAWAADVVHLPPSLEVEIRVHKGTEPLGNYYLFCIPSVQLKKNLYLISKSYLIRQRRFI